MFCSRCGQQVEEGHRFCPACGQPMGMAVVPVAAGPGVAAVSTRYERHRQLLGILWIVASALNLMGAAVLLLLSRFLFFPIEGPPFVRFFLPGLFTFLGVLVLAKALGGFAAGFGLLQRESWARVLALVLGFISLLNIPFGTALGIYTIWVLLANDTARAQANVRVA